jgi:hypothetical protein
VDVARVVEASLARSAAAQGAVVMSASKKLVVATLFTGVLAAGAAVLLAGLGVLGARGSGGGNVPAAGGGRGAQQADDGGSAGGGSGGGSTARSRPRAARPPADDAAATVSVQAELPVSAAADAGVASVARDPKLQTQRDKYREKQERAGVRGYLDLTYGVLAGTEAKPLIDSRWTFPAHRDGAKEESGIQFSAVFADPRGGEPGAITLRVQKFIHKSGKSEFSVPFAHAGVSPRTADAKGMIGGYFAEYAAAFTDVGRPAASSRGSRGSDQRTTSPPSSGRLRRRSSANAWTSTFGRVRTRRGSARSRTPGPASGTPRSSRRRSRYS